MAITDFASLNEAVAAWLHRDDLTARIPEFITLAENHLNADLYAREMQTRFSFTMSSGVQYYTLPSDLLEMRRLKVFSDPIQVMKYATPDEIDNDYPHSISGIPKVFCVIGNELQVAPIPDGTYQAEMIYAQALASLSESNTANWLITKYPNAYLYATLMAAQFYIEDENMTAMINAAYREAVDNINSVDWYSGTTMTVRAH